MPRKTIKSLEKELAIVRQLRSGDIRSTQFLQEERNKLQKDNLSGSRRLQEANAEIHFLRETITLLAQTLKTGA